jgi:hypothetical protein
VHDAVTGRDNVYILERGLGPLDEVEAVFVTTVFDLAVLPEGIRVETRRFHRQRVIHNQLSRHNRVDQGGVTALIGNRVTQTCEIDQGGLTQDVVANDAGGIPGKIQIALAFDQLFQRISQGFRFAAAHQLFCQDFGGVG